MATTAPVILFAPVSSSQGIGEYVRSTIVADAIHRRWPAIQIHFVLSRQAPYAQHCRYQTHFTELSPTKHPKEINALIDELCPDLVIFDASGRRTQLQHAQRSGAKVVFISQHDRKLNRGLKWGRLKVTDSHWVAQPEFVMAGLSWLQHAKLKWSKKSAPLFAGPIFTPVHHKQQQALLDRLGLQRHQFIVFNAGSGGHRLKSGLAASLFAEVAALAAANNTLKVVMVFGANFPDKPPSLPGVITIDQLDNQQFINLLEAAKAAVLSGGDALLQAISLHKPTLAVPVSRDQPHRVDACNTQKVILASPASVDAMSAQLHQLMSPAQQQQLVDNMKRLDINNGLITALREVARLLNLKTDQPPVG